MGQPPCPRTPSAIPTRGSSCPRSQMDLGGAGAPRSPHRSAPCSSSPRPGCAGLRTPPSPRARCRWRGGRRWQRAPSPGAAPSGCTGRTAGGAQHHGVSPGTPTASPCSRGLCQLCSLLPGAKPSPPSHARCSPHPPQLPEVLTVQLPAHRFWIAPADASRMAGVLLSFSREMYIRTTSGWNSSS